MSTSSVVTINSNSNGNVNIHDNRDNNNNNNNWSTVADTDMTTVRLDSSTNGETSSSSMHSVSTHSNVKSKNRTLHTAKNRKNNARSRNVDVDEWEQANSEIQSKVRYAFRDFQKKITRRAQQQH